MKKTKEAKNSMDTMLPSPATVTKVEENPKVTITKEEKMTTKTEAQNVCVTPTNSDMALEAIRRDLPEVVEKVEHLITLMDPNKPGYEEMGGPRWAPPIIRIHQALSRNTPGNSKLGNLYTDTGDVLPTPFEFVPIYMHYAHTRFSQGNEEDRNRLCRSEDTIQSIRGQLCAECPDRPFRDGQITECKKSIEVFVFDKAFQNIYKLQFVKTNYKVGSKLYRQTSSGAVPWERVYALGTETAMQEKTGSKYYVYTMTPTGEKIDPRYDPLARFIHQKIAEVRKHIKESIRNQIDVAEDIIRHGIPEDFAQNDSTPKSGLTNM